MNEPSISKIIDMYSDVDLANLDIRKLLLILETDVSLLKSTSEGFQLLKKLPLESIYSFAITESVSVYWPLLALDWIEQVHLQLSSNLLEVLNVSVKAKWATQVYKQRVKKILYNQDKYATDLYSDKCS